MGTNKSDETKKVGPVTVTQCLSQLQARLVCHEVLRLDFEHRSGCGPRTLAPRARDIEQKVTPQLSDDVEPWRSAGHSGDSRNWRHRQDNRE